DPRRGSTDPEAQDDCGHNDGRKSHEGEEENGDADQTTHILSLLTLLLLNGQKSGAFWSAGAAVLGARENPVSRLVDIAVLAEPDELDKGAIVHDHGGSDAFRRRPGRIDDFLALESSLEVVDFECHMGHGLDELG